MNTDKQVRNPVVHHRKLLIGLLLAAILAVDAAVGSIFADQNDYAFLRWPDPRAKLWLALAVSQIALVAIWVGLGRTVVVVRIAALAATAVAWGAFSLGPLLFGYGTVHRVQMELTVRFLCQGLAICFALLVARRCGLRLSGSADTPGVTVPPGRFQFSIANMLSWTTSVAVILGLSRYMGTTFPWAVLAGEHFPWLLIGELCLGEAALVLAVLWGALGTGQFGWRAVAMLGVFLGVLLLHAPWAGLAHTASLTDYCQLCFLEALLIFVPLLVFRVAGYRLIVGRG
jgi:hypothetical protein